MTNNAFVSNVTSALTLFIAVAFLGVSTVGIVSPVKAQSAVSSTAR